MGAWGAEEDGLLPQEPTHPSPFPEARPGLHLCHQVQGKVSEHRVEGDPGEPTSEAAQAGGRHHLCEGGSS